MPIPLRSLARRLALVAWVLASAAVAASPALAASAQDVRASLFAQADRALEEARRARADILAPRTFSEAMRNYQAAEEDLKRGRDLERIRRSLRAATEGFAKAMQAAPLAEVTLATAIAAREDARNAEAPKFAQRAWTDAERKFEEAARELEAGDVNGAKRRGAEAERIYRDTELAAIKGNYLSETLELLRQAERQDADERAPQTLRRARDLAARAEKLLTENRYDTDEARVLAQEAKREARHALYVAQRVREIDRGGEQTAEQVLLSTEEPLRRIAAAMDVAVSFEEGPAAATDAIVGHIATYQDSLQALRSELEGRQEQIAILEARVAEVEQQVTGLQQRLGGAEEEKSDLARRLEEQARLRERFARVEKLFTRDEARVLREGDDILIRLYGLSFPVGRSTIDAKYFSLLTKVRQAIDEFPGSRVTIEGHTDSFGGDEANLSLSQERADAVRHYFLANTRIDPTRIESLGHGEARPVASNETQEGRARNRRIDVVIHPNLTAP